MSTHTTRSPSERRHQSHCRDTLIDSLRNDHRAVKRLFKQLMSEDGGLDDAARTQLLGRLCRDLTVHTRLEEETLYPAARAQIEDRQVIEEALIEHASVSALIGQLQTTAPDEPRQAALLKVLSEYVTHHVKEEEKVMFPRLMRAAIDWDGLLRQTEARRARLGANGPQEPHGGR